MESRPSPKIYKFIHNNIEILNKLENMIHKCIDLPYGISLSALSKNIAHITEIISDNEVINYFMEIIDKIKEEDLIIINNLILYIYNIECISSDRTISSYIPWIIPLIYTNNGYILPFNCVFLLEKRNIQTRMDIDNLYPGINIIGIEVIHITPDKNDFNFYFLYDTGNMDNIFTYKNNKYTIKLGKNYENNKKLE